MAGPTRDKNAKLWERHPEDWYVDPDWCSARLFDEERFEGQIHDPFCGAGSIIRSAVSKGLQVSGYDIAHPQERDMAEHSWHSMNYLMDGRLHRNIVSNPPFSLCDPRKDKSQCCVRHALNHSIGKIAFLIPTSWMNAAGRGAWLETTRLQTVYLLGPRPSMPPGPVIQAGIKPGNGTKDFAWFVWQHGFEGTPQLKWLRRDR